MTAKAVLLARSLIDSRTKNVLVEQAAYVMKDDAGECVLPIQCVNRCPNANEKYSLCGTACPRTCSNKDELALKCTKNCVQGCFCLEGYVRDDSGVCILPENCRCTDPNAELVKNPPCCGGGTCAKPDWITGCGKKSDPKGCQCKKGYCKKSETDATCIAVKDCKKQVPLPYDK